jgi:hypothetical protein
MLRVAVFAVVMVLGFGVVPEVGSSAPEARRDTCMRGDGRAFGPATPPFGPALQLRHVDEARARLSFVPRLLAGRPFRVYVSREREQRLRRLGLVYRSSPARWFQLTQGRLTLSVARFEESLRELADRDLCGARSSTFRLHNGTLALLTEADDRRLVVLQHKGLELMLFTSPEGSSATRLRALANALSRS